MHRIDFVVSLVTAKHSNCDRGTKELYKAEAIHF